MKNVLFISSHFLNGGLENRICGQVKEYKKKKINSFLACEYFDKKHEYIFQDILTGMPFTPKNNSYLIDDILRAKNILVDFCKKNKIDFIDCQPFWCNIPAALAANECNIPISFTLHGISSGDFIDDSFMAAKILNDLCLSYGYDAIFAVAEYLTKIYSYINNQITIVRNGTEYINKNLMAGQKSGNFAIASRLDSVKTDLIAEFLPILSQLDIVKRIDIYGDGEEKNRLEVFIKNNDPYHKINLLGWNNHLQKAFANKRYDAVFGMGRVVLDAISVGTPVGILGYGGFAGFLTKQSFGNFLKTNLTSWRKLDEAEVKEQLASLYNKKDDFIFDKNTLSETDQAQIWQKHLVDCGLLSYIKKPIIDNLNCLLERYSKYDLLTNNDEFINELINLLLQYNCTIRINLLKKYLTDQSEQYLKLLDQRQQEITQLLNSTSWKVTKPLRYVSQKMQNITKKIEIIAVVCAYNEELNVDGCLTHLEKYVDKIVLFDDGSTDKTITIAKRHHKVTKIIKNSHKSNWNERKNREEVLRMAYKISKKQNVWALCVDADERFEMNFLLNLQHIANKNPNKVITVHFRELWDNISHYRCDGIWNTKQKAIFFPLAKKMTFNYQNEHHIPWYYAELGGLEMLADYNLYHLKMIRQEDRKKRVSLYNTLDPDKIMQPIGYDYLNDNINLELCAVPDKKSFDTSTVPKYYL